MVKIADAKFLIEQQEKYNFEREVRRLVQACCFRLVINASESSLVGIIGTGREGSNFSAILAWVKTQYPTQNEQRSLILDDLALELHKELQRKCSDHMLS